MAIRYAEDKPKSCEYCYFWNEKKKECRQMRCFYQLPEKPPDPDPAHRFWVPCKRLSVWKKSLYWLLHG